MYGQMAYCIQHGDAAYEDMNSSTRGGAIYSPGLRLTATYRMLDKLDPLTCGCGFSHNLFVAIYDTNEAVISLKDLSHTLLLWLELAGHTEQIRLHFFQGGVQLLDGQRWDKVQTGVINNAWAYMLATVL